ISRARGRRDPRGGNAQPTACRGRHVRGAVSVAGGRLPVTAARCAILGEVTPLTGLTSAEAAARYAAGQHNRPPEPGTKSIREIWLGNLFIVFNLVIGGLLLLLVAFLIAASDIRLLQDCAGEFFVAALKPSMPRTQAVLPTTPC